MKVDESQPLELNSSAGGPAPTEKPRVGFVFFLVTAMVIAVIGWFIYKGISARVSADAAVERETRRAAILTVSVVEPTLSRCLAGTDSSGNTQALIDAPIYARTSGYLKRWYADMGLGFMQVNCSQRLKRRKWITSYSRQERIWQRRRRISGWRKRQRHAGSSC